MLPNIAFTQFVLLAPFFFSFYVVTKVASANYGAATKAQTSTTAGEQLGAGLRYCNRFFFASQNNNTRMVSLGLRVATWNVRLFWLVLVVKVG